MSIPLLTSLIALPLAGAVLTALVPGKRPNLARGVALTFCAFTLLRLVWLWTQFDTGSGELQFVEQVAWIPALNVEYHLGVDGLSLMLAILTAILTPFALIAPIGNRANPAGYYALILVLQAMVFGVFFSLNFILWFLFWELTLVPAFLLIKIWGGPMRAAAAYQFFIYTMAGSIAMLLGFLLIYLVTGTFDFVALAELGRSGTLTNPFKLHFDASGEALLWLAFVGIFIGLAVKVPVFPLHTWLPEAYAQAPAGTSMLLTGLLSKMGLYGFLRILLPIFPIHVQALQPLLLTLAIVTIIFPALAALAQTDLKRILAYSSINHLGYCLLGLFAATTWIGSGSIGVAREAALSGVYLQIFNHGVIAATLFYFVGLLEARSGGLRDLDDFGGLRKVAPFLCAFMGIALFASLGLPGLSGFVGEFLIFLGVFSLNPWAAALAVPGLLITAVFLLRILGRVFNGPLADKWSDFPDLSLSERLMVLPAILLIILLGIYPAPLMHVFNQSVSLTLRLLQ